MRVHSTYDIHSAIASWLHSYCDTVLTKFIVNNRADALKPGVNLFFTLTNCQIVRLMTMEISQ